MLRRRFTPRVQFSGILVKMGSRNNRSCATSSEKGNQPPAAEKKECIIDGMDYTGYLPKEEYQQVHLVPLQQKYGQGTADLHRVLYKEMCDELRREKYTKPPSPEYSYTEWSMEHKPGSSKLVFRKSGDNFQVVVGADIKLTDPKQINETLTFLNWFPFDVLIRRESVIMHYMVASVERQLIIRNVRAYMVDEKVDLMSFGAESDFQRFFQRYDGPFLYHLELDMQTELYDIMFDTGVTSHFVRYASEWVEYLEHVEYVRWLINMLEVTIPGSVDDERQLLSLEERRALDEEAEEWRDAVRL